MLSLKQKQSGFTIVELLIVIVIIGILAGLVITTFVGVQAKARDSERKTDINAVQKQLEAYFATYGGYPSASDLNSSSWRSGNQFKIDTKALADPSSPTTTTLTAGASVGSNKVYYYGPGVNGTYSATCVSPTDSSGTSVTSGTICNSFMVGANLEATSGTYVQTSQ